MNVGEKRYKIDGDYCSSNYRWKLEIKMCIFMCCFDFDGNLGTTHSLTESTALHILYIAITSGR